MKAVVAYFNALSSTPRKIVKVRSHDEKRGSAVGTEIGYGLDDWSRVQHFQSSLLYPMSTGGEAADHSLATSGEVKTTWIYTSTPPYTFMEQCLAS
jgi:hypothetical protein